MSNHPRKIHQSAPKHHPKSMTPKRCPPEPNKPSISQSQIVVGGPSGEVDTRLPNARKSLKPPQATLKSPKSPKKTQQSPPFSTPKRKRCTTSPPPAENISKTPRLAKNLEKIHQASATQPPPPAKIKMKALTKKNPHPSHNLQEFVKTGTTLTLVKHNGLACSSRKSLKRPPKNINTLELEIITQETPPPKEISHKNLSNQTPRRCKNFSELLENFSPKNLSNPKKNLARKTKPPKSDEEKSVNQAEKTKSLRCENATLYHQLPKVTSEKTIATSNVSFIEKISRKIL